eukprot:8307463-Pyramimonas_sp.AAC.1
MCRERVEKKVEEATEILKASGRTRARDVAGAVAALTEILSYNTAMSALASEEGVALGVGPVTLFGGAFHEGNRTDELRDLYRMYLAEHVKDGTFSAEASAALANLQGVFGLGKKEAASITLDVVTKCYRNYLRRAVQDGSLDAAESKAAFLTDLCERLQFESEVAASVHSDIYKQKLESLLEKKALNDDDME